MSRWDDPLAASHEHDDDDEVVDVTEVSDESEVKDEMASSPRGRRERRAKQGSVDQEGGDGSDTMSVKSQVCSEKRLRGKQKSKNDD